jgi:Ser/Thr protein kinase RdoA (MazF antagonist)
VRLFPLIEADHPFYPQVRAFAAQIGERVDESAAPAVIHAEIKALRTPDRQWALDRFYWSRQTWDGASRIRFQADTLTFRASLGRAEWHRFPDDPYLDAMSAGIARLLAGRPEARLDVLRYVPLRRLTFRLDEDEAAAVVGKFKRRSRFQEAHARLQAVARAAAQPGAPFRVATPLALDAAYGLSLQEALQGTNLAEAITPESGPELLYRLGATHRALHMLSVPGLPAWDGAQFRAGVERDLAWIGFVRPELAEDLARARRALERTGAASECVEPVFCHGDFVPSQVLADGDAWAVIDFDLCRQGDPYQELAMLIAALPYDVPALRAAPPMLLEQLAACYLAGYRERAGGDLRQSRLLWYRVCAELYYLSVALKKDWLDLAGLRQAVGRLRELVARLEQSEVRRCNRS